MNQSILLILLLTIFNVTLWADSPKTVRGVMILTSASGSDPRNVLFSDEVWTDFYGGNVIDAGGQKSDFSKKDIGKIIYFDSAYYFQLDNDQQENAFRAGIQTREVVINTSFLNLNATNDLNSLKGSEGSLENLVHDYPGIQSLIQPQIDLLNEDISKLTSGRSLVNGQWMSEDQAIALSAVPVVGETNKPVTFTTRDGKKFVNAKVTLSDDGLSVLTPDGGASVSFEQLPDDLSAFPASVRKVIIGKRSHPARQAATLLQSQPTATGPMDKAEIPANEAGNVVPGPGQGTGVLSGLALQRCERHPFHIQFKGYEKVNDMYVFQLYLSDVPRSQQPKPKKSGDELGFGGFIVGPFHQILKPGADPNTKVPTNTDQSTIELDQPGIVSKVIIPLKVEIDSPQVTADFVVRTASGSNQAIQVPVGEKLTLPSAPQRSFVVVDANDDGATIRDAITQEEYAISKVTPPVIYPTMTGRDADGQSLNPAVSQGQGSDLPETKFEAAIISNYTAEQIQSQSVRTVESDYFVPTFSDELPATEVIGGKGVVDTIQFINHKLQDRYIMYYDGRLKKFVMGAAVFTTRGRIRLEKWPIMTFDPSTLNPDKIEKSTQNDRIMVGVSTTNNKKLVEGLTFNGIPIQGDGLNLPVEDDHDAQSVCNALIHLIQLYGGRSEDF